MGNLYGRVGNRLDLGHQVMMSHSSTLATNCKTMFQGLQNPHAVIQIDFKLNKTKYK